jgi:hypothetical protein
MSPGREATGWSTYFFKQKNSMIRVMPIPAELPANQQTQRPISAGQLEFAGNSSILVQKWR